MTASVCVFYSSIYIYLFTCLSICNLHIVSQFIYLFTFNDPSQESSFLKEEGFLGRRRSMYRNRYGKHVRTRILRTRLRCVEILTSDINDQECLNTNTVKRTLHYVLYI